ncbi:hypothetical protein JOQ06_020139 [Pogonophryne albipinna]|uniref:Uncharacterized protein n=1 Tax=Pogonophryne albipinna TaxID=1090488 RepID=A0AAD6FVA6_9TELE|nr:hypothetical protein JOQ06_020139 [Pogonophryne albipinna]
MASKLNPNVLYVAEPGESLGSPQDSERTHIAGEAGEESSDSDGEQEETSHKLIRKVSTSGQIRAKVGSDGVKESTVDLLCGWSSPSRQLGTQVAPRLIYPLVL